MPQPNIVFILIDDMGWMDLACQGSSFYETPHLDRLAAEGMRFSDAYAACPVCSPTRASLLTGRYPARVGVTNFIGGNARGRLLDAPYTRQLPLEQRSLAAALREGGYATWHVGKWHLGGQPYWPENHGFDVNVGGWDAGAPKSYWSPYANPRLPDGPPGEYLTDRLTDEAVALIRRRDTSRPFFLNLWHYAVHIPIQSKPELIRKYEAKAAACGLAGRDPFILGEPFPCEHKRTKRVVRRMFQSDPAYAAMVEDLDTSVGRVLASLDEQGIADETVVIFTSDNGGVATAEGSPTCNAPLCEGKGWMYEGGTREPLIVRWPGRVPPASVCAAPLSSPDFYPTLLELAGLPLRPEQHCDGASFATTLTGNRVPDTGNRQEATPRSSSLPPSVPPRDRDRLFPSPRALFWHYPHYGNQGGTPGCSVRWGDWKLIEFFEDRRVELYNLRQDISEEHDLSGDEKETADRLRDALHRWLDDVGAKIPAPNPDWSPAG